MTFSITILFKALQKGFIMENPVAGKRLQLTIVPSLVILSLLLQMIGLDASVEQLNTIIAGLDTAAVLLNTYLTTSTTDKIGL